MAVKFPDLKRGTQGDAVLWLQQRLRAVGFDPGSSQGVFDGDTETAVRAFQASMDLPITGAVDAPFWSTLTQLRPEGSNTPLLERNIQNPYQRHLRSDDHSSGDRPIGARKDGGQ